MGKELEIYNALLFQQTVADSWWLRNKSFSPGRWAVDFRFLYTLFRILDHVRPSNIIEFGLGQSSRMIHQYVAFGHSDASALTVEESEQWQVFFLNNIMDYAVNVVIAGTEERVKNNRKEIVYTGLDNIIDSERYDLIVIDGPKGKEECSRSQVTDMLPFHLSEQFVILMDDTHRPEEQYTVDRIAEILCQHHIPYRRKEYYGEKTHSLICSCELEYLTTL